MMQDVADRTIVLYVRDGDPACKLIVMVRSIKRDLCQYIKVMSLVLMVSCPEGRVCVA